MRVINLTLKDFRQLLRDWKTAFFLVIMPVVFTLLFGFAFGGFGSQTDANEPPLPTPIGVLDQDATPFSEALIDALFSLGNYSLVGDTADGLEQQTLAGDIVAALIIPPGFGQALSSGAVPDLTLIADTGVDAGFQARAMVDKAMLRVSSAATAGRLAAEQADDPQLLMPTFQQTLRAWETPPLVVTRTQAGPTSNDDRQYDNAFAHSSPGMMAQFAIAGLIGAASILVTERKTRALRRLLTTAISRPQILLGHYLAMFGMIFTQLLVLCLFGQLFLRLDYFGHALATLLMLVTASLFCASLGLLIGSLAKSEEQVIVFSLIPMFVLSALGGAWTPLEFTAESFQRVAFFTPVAWLTDGLKDIVVRGQGLESVWLAGLVLLAYAVAFAALALWRFRFE